MLTEISRRRSLHAYAHSLTQSHRCITTVRWKSIPSKHTDNNRTPKAFHLHAYQHEEMTCTCTHMQFHRPLKCRAAQLWTKKEPVSLYGCHGSTLCTPNSRAELRETLVISLLLPSCACLSLCKTNPMQHLAVANRADGWASEHHTTHLSRPTSGAVYLGAGRFPMWPQPWCVIHGRMEDVDARTRLVYSKKNSLWLGSYVCLCVTGAF